MPDQLAKLQSETLALRAKENSVKQSSCKFAFALAILLAPMVARAALPQNPPSLESALRQQFKTTRLAPSPTGIVVTDQGAILTITKPGIRAYPPAMLVLATNKVLDGNIDTPKDNPFLGPSLLLPQDTKVYVMKVSVDAKKDRVIFIVMQCDPCNNAPQPSYFKAQIAFQFPQGYLAGADAGQVSDVVSQILAPENAGGDASGQQQQEQQPQNPDQRAVQSTDQVPAAAPPQQETQTISKGQTEDQVVAVLGQPSKIVDLGVKKLYIYKDMKITFINGKVADVQ